MCIHHRVISPFARSNSVNGRGWEGTTATAKRLRGEAVVLILRSERDGFGRCEKSGGPSKSTT